MLILEVKNFACNISSFVSIYLSPRPVYVSFLLRRLNGLPQSHKISPFEKNLAGMDYYYLVGNYESKAEQLNA
jgi:hypothetical protein